MQYIYHLKHPDFRGTTIYPLHQLRGHFPDLFERQVAKYAGREHSLEIRLPLLDVLWNDVVHCAPVHPYLLYKALVDTGHSPSPAREWFRIPVDRIAGHKALYWRNLTFGADKAPATEFEYFDPATYEELKQIPDIHLDYLREQSLLNRQPLFAMRVPHVLVHGTIDVSNLDTVSWGEAASKGDREH